MSGQKAHIIKTTDNKKEYRHYISGKDKNTRFGVGIVVGIQCNADFLPVNDRICKLRIHGSGNEPDTVVICAYAPTLDVSKNHPDRRENFYNDLEQQVKSVNQRDFLVIGGDFNAKCGSAYAEYPNHMGRFGKGEVNENGYELLDFCMRNNLILTNTVFKHKLSHITTWKSPEIPSATCKNGELRRNPIRNQIDFVIVRNTCMKFVTNSRSYSGMHTRTDHRLVLANLKHALPKPFRRPPTDEKTYNLDRLKFPLYSNAYKEKLRENLNSIDIKQSSTQEKWNHIVQSTHAASESILGHKEKKKKKV